jgi:two-component system sensor histidine kinase ResE
MSDAALSPQHKQLLQMTEDGARRIESLLEKANHLSSLQAGLIHFELSRHDLGAIVREVITEIRPTAASAGVELTLEGGGLFNVDCDAEQIHRSVAALLSNAVRHSPRPGTVEITLTARDSCASLSVMDRGPGIPEHFLPRIFDCFSVPDVSKHSSGQGQGLSLATARAVVSSHGGVLSAENQLGGGAAFELQLPLADSAESNPAEHPTGGSTGRDR